MKGTTKVNMDVTSKLRKQENTSEIGQQNLDKERTARLPLAPLSRLQLLAHEFDSCKGDPSAGLLGPKFATRQSGELRQAHVFGYASTYNQWRL